MFAWTLISKPAGSNAIIAPGTLKAPTFVADVPGAYIASLTVNDGKATSSADQITVLSVAKPEVSSSILPSANAGANQNVLVGASVLVDANASKSASGKALSYRWSLTTRPPGSMAVLSAITAKATFTADKVGSYAATLLVSDGTLESAAATTFIVASSPPTQSNLPPVANAGADQTGAPGVLVTLDGSLSKDANGDTISYSWSLVSKPTGSAAALATTTVVKSSFVPDLAGIYDVMLSVNDGKSSVASTDTISVVIFSPTSVVVADTGIYRCSSISKAQAVLLYSQGHTYLDRDHDGKPCEANDILNELAGTTTTTGSTATSSGQCYVNGYYRSNGTYVRGYYRSCPR